VHIWRCTQGFEPGFRSYFNMLVKYFFLAISIMPFWGILSAQSVPAINYTTKEGLPSNECYDLLVDSYNRLWIATDRGVAMYDGYKFSNYTNLDGLSDNTNFEIFKNPLDSSLWFASYDGTISIFKDGAFAPWKMNDELLKKSKGKWITHLEFCRSEIFLSTYKEGEFYLLADLQKETVEKIIVDSKSLGHDGKNDFVKVHFCEKNLLLKRKLGFATNYVRNAQDQILYSTIGSKLYHGDQDMNFPNAEIDFLEMIDQDQLLICSKAGIEKYDLTDEKLVKVFPDAIASCVVKDLESNYWVSTLDQGIFKIPNLEMKYFDASHFGGKKIGGFGQAEDGNLFVANVKAELFDVEVENDDVSVTSITQDFSFLSTTSYHLKGKWARYQPGRFGFTLEAFLHYRLSVAETGLRLLNKEGYEVFTTESVATSRITALSQLGESIMVGTMNGLFTIRKDSIGTGFIMEKVGEIKERVSDMQVLDDERVAISTMEGGLLVYQAHSHVVHSLGGSKNDHVPSNIVNTLYCENENVWWLGTNQGLNRFDVEKTDTSYEIREVKSYSIDDGLASNFVTDIIHHQEELWVAFDDGIQSINLSQINRMGYTPQIIGIELIIIKDEKTITDGDRLGFDENSLELRFTGILHDKPLGRSFYRHRLVRNSVAQAWHETNNQTVRFTNLMHGDYQIELQAMGRDGSYSKSYIKRFNIRKHFTSTIWFWSIVAIGSLILLFILYRFRVRKLERDKTISQISFKLKNAELDALRAQMNPHFIFNAMNSIQNFIFQKDVEKANYYLNKFAMLVRKSLEYSGKNYISLEEELEFLDRYVELEQMRFEGGFSFTSTIDKALLEEEILIPPMIIQPIVENSIKHGFKNIDYQGSIEVEAKLHEEDSTIEIAVEDNGSNYLSNHEQKKEKSFGLNLIERRLGLLFPGDLPRIKHGPMMSKPGYSTSIFIPITDEA